MTYLVEAGGMAVPASVTAFAGSHERAASIVAQVSHPDEIITVEQALGREIERRWFRVIAPAPGSRTAAVAEVRMKASGNIVRLRGRHD